MVASAIKSVKFSPNVESVIRYYDEREYEIILPTDPLWTSIPTGISSFANFAVIGHSRRAIVTLRTVTDPIVPQLTVDCEAVGWELDKINIPSNA